VSARRAMLISVDGVSGTAVAAAARVALAGVARSHRGGVSTWDASGLFQDLIVAEEEAGIPSARTLLLLYAADLAFRLRWEIRPALEAGRVVVAAPYVDSATLLRLLGLRPVAVDDERWSEALAGAVVARSREQVARAVDVALRD